MSVPTNLELIKKLNFAEHFVQIYKLSTKEQTGILPYIREPESFYGDPVVDEIVCFQNTFTGLIGKYQEQFGEWNGQKLAEQKIIALEQHYEEAKKLAENINVLAGKIFQNPALYDDKSFCGDYYELTKQGYDMLRAHEKEFGLSLAKTTLISLERAGLVSTRLALGVDDDTDNLLQEVRVVTKRTHLKSQPQNYLTVTIKWRDLESLRTMIREQEIAICDFVNPASGASTAAFILSATAQGNKPTTIHHRSISMTKQGVLFNQQAFAKLGISSTFYSIGLADELNEMYYLIGNRAVGDAGHILRHFLPNWYVA